MISDFIGGFLIECAFIMTVGLQNAFILRQGIKKEYSLAVVVTCTFCECTLVSIGIAGMGAVIAARPMLIKVITGLGAAFLIFYGIKSLYSAFKSENKLDIDKAERNSKTLGQIIITAVAFSWLNPHVLLDTTLMGALSAKYHPHEWVFAFGVFSAAFVWYSFLALVGKTLAKPLNTPKTWKFINIAIAILCAYMAYSFISDTIGGHEHEHAENHEIIEVMGK